MRLPKPVYESLPWLYVAAGAGLLYLGYRLRPQGLASGLSVVGFLGIIGGVVVALRRRDYRSSHREYWQRGSSQDDSTLGDDAQR